MGKLHLNAGGDRTDRHKHKIWALITHWLIRRALLRRHAG